MSVCRCITRSRFFSMVTSSSSSERSSSSMGRRPCAPPSKIPRSLGGVAHDDGVDVVPFHHRVEQPQHPICLDTALDVRRVVALKMRELVVEVGELQACVSVVLALECFDGFVDPLRATPQSASRSFPPIGTATASSQRRASEKAKEWVAYRRRLSQQVLRRRGARAGAGPRGRGARARGRRRRGRAATRGRVETLWHAWAARREFSRSVCGPPARSPTSPTAWAIVHAGPPHALRSPNPTTRPRCGVALLEGGVGDRVSCRRSISLSPPQTLSLCENRRAGGGGRGQRERERERETLCLSRERVD